LYEILHREYLLIFVDVFGARLSGHVTQKKKISFRGTSWM